VRREVARHAEFASISEQIAEVNEKICEARPVAAADSPSGTEGEKGGLFVGSGLVEAGCKSVIGHRLKRAGMHWTVNGADAIAALRCQQASRPEDPIWPARRDQAKAA
jgi:hypothetical protein